jgi:hypothetical protein
MRARESGHESADHNLIKASFGKERRESEPKFSNQPSDSNLLGLDVHALESVRRVEEVDLIVPSDPQSPPGKVSTSGTCSDIENA